MLEKGKPGSDPEIRPQMDEVKTKTNTLSQAGNDKATQYLAEIHMRARRRIGEISAGLEKAERARTDLHPTAGIQSKTQTLSQAGIPRRDAHTTS